MIDIGRTPEGDEFPLHGISLQVTLTLDAIAAAYHETIKSTLGDSDIYSLMKHELADFADSQICETFNGDPWRSFNFTAPSPMWNNDDDEFITSQLTPLLLLGPDFDIRMEESNYDTHVEMVESNAFCSGCKALVGDEVLRILNDMELTGIIDIETEVEGFGSG